MERGRKVLCRTVVKQGNTGIILDRESTIISIRKCKLKQAFSTIKTNATRKKVFQTSHGVAEVVLVLAICILHGGYLFESTLVGQGTAFFCGEDGLAEARWSTTLEGIPTTTNILEENVSSSIGWINNWNNNIQMYRIRGHVYALNIIQSGYTGSNTSQKQNIRVAIIGKW